METTIKTEAFGYETEIRSDGKYNMSEILKRYNETSTVKKRMDVFLKSKETEAFIGLLKQDGMTDLYELVKEKQDGCRPMKHTWWFDIHLLVLFIMRLDDVTRKNIVKKIADYVFLSALEERFENIAALLGITGDAQKCETVVAGLDYVVFRKHEPSLWKSASNEQRTEFCMLIDKYAPKIKDGMDYDLFVQTLRDIYKSTVSNSPK